MDGYLVWLRHTMDDLPIGLFPHTAKGKAEACIFAGETKPMPTAKIRKVLGVDCSTPVCVSVVEFVGGKPVGVIGSIDF